MTNESLDTEELARTLIRNYGNEAPHQAEVLARQTFIHATAETSRILREVLKAINQIRAARLT